MGRQSRRRKRARELLRQEIQQIFKEASHRPTKRIGRPRGQNGDSAGSPGLGKRA